MDDKVDIKKLKQLLKSVKLLYVEDNAGLLKKATIFFSKLFTDVYQAKNGKEGYELFKKHRPDIIITDIQMPNVDGLEMASAIRKLDNDVKIIITTAHDDKEYLLRTIDIGVTGYLKKPVIKDALINLLSKVAQDITDEKNKNIFNNHLYNIFNNQDSLLFMIRDNEIVLVNDRSLEFFGLNNLNEFREKFKDFGSLLLPHDTFLYEEDDNVDYLQKLKANQGKLFNAKIRNKGNDLHHLLIKLSTIQERENSYILSLNDVTELNLLGIYDSKALDNDKALQDQHNILNLLNLAMESKAEIKIHNYYKGLSITHNAVITEATQEKVIFKTVYLQQKAISLENRVVLTSELFPFDIESKNIQAVNYQNQTVEISHCNMIRTSPTMRKNITLDSDIADKVTLLYNEHKFDTEMSIVNLSINSIKLSLNFLPAGLKEEDSVNVHLVLNEDKKPIMVHADAKVNRIIKYENNFELVLKFDVEANINKILVDYIAKRQMKLIREFKGLQYEE